MKMLWGDLFVVDTNHHTLVGVNTVRGRGVGGAHLTSALARGLSPS